MGNRKIDFLCIFFDTVLIIQAVTVQFCRIAFCSICVILVCVLLVSTHFTLRNQTQILIFSFSFFVTCFSLYIIGKVWLKELYGKYINEISGLIQSLNEDDCFDVDRKTINIDYNFKNPFFESTKSFFRKHFGEKGNQINILFWMLISFIFLMIISGLIGYAVGYLGAKYNLLDAKASLS